MSLKGGGHSNCSLAGIVGLGLMWLVVCPCEHAEVLEDSLQPGVANLVGGIGKELEFEIHLACSGLSVNSVLIREGCLVLVW